MIREFYRKNRWIKYAVIALYLSIFFLSCKTKTVYVPVEKWKTEIEFIDRIERDSFFVVQDRAVKDSIVIKDSIVYILDEKGDVVSKELYKWKERYRENNYLLNQLQIKYDSLLYVKQDSTKIDVPYPVPGPEVNKLKKWQIVLMLLGSVFIGCMVFRLISFFY